MDNSHSIFLSVIIPVYNAENTLKNCIQSILDQDYPSDAFEVLLVDNASTDNTRKIIEEYISLSSGRILYIYEPKKGAACARNAGIRLAKGTVLCFTDSDCVVAPNWLSNIVDIFHDMNISALQGKIVLAPVAADLKNDVLSEDFIRRIFAHVNYGVGLLRMSPDLDMVSANIAVRKEIFIKHGMFNEKIKACEDTELSRRFERMGVKRYYSSDVVIFHHFSVGRVEQKKILDQFYNWGRAAVFMGDFDTSHIRYIVYLIRILSRKYLEFIVQVLRNDKKKVFELLCTIAGLRGRLHELMVYMFQKKNEVTV